MKIIVTGGAGFIGSHLVEYLVKKRHEVAVIDNLSCGNIQNLSDVINDINFINADLSVKDGWEKSFKNADWVFHLAALSRIQPSFEDPISHDEATVRSTLNIVTSLKDFNIKALVISSSSAIYGNPLSFPTKETERVDPLSPYALQKYAEERYAHILCERYKIPVTSLRYFNVFGKRSFDQSNAHNAYSSVIGIFNQQKLNNEKLTITGDGMQKRDFVHVSDVVRANVVVAKEIEKTNGNSYNVGYGEAYSVLDVAKYFNHEYEFIKERLGEASITLSDCTKLKNIGWNPEISLFHAINKNLI